MIGGYLYHEKNNEIVEKLNKTLDKSYHKILLGDSGFLFHDDPYSDSKTSIYSSERLSMISQDLLVGDDRAGGYSEMKINENFADRFVDIGTGLFNDVVSEFRLIVVDNTNDETKLYLVSNRAGNGRMYYYQDDSGILFSTDIRFLLQILPLKVNDIAVFAILKYGAAPEPMTISENIMAVPAAHYLSFNLRNNENKIKPYFKFEFPSDHEQSNNNLDLYLQPAKQKLIKSAEFLSKYNPSILISGGIDSSLYASYLDQVSENRFDAFNCIFGTDDPEFAYAEKLANKITCNFQVGRMDAEKDVISTLNDAVALTGHPFSDFSSLPIVYILKFMKEHASESHMLIEGNGGDDCFGFPDLTTQAKMNMKHIFPGMIKGLIASIYKNSASWKIESQNSTLARILALSDTHELNPNNYFLTLTPANFLNLNTYKSWDRIVTNTMEDVFSNLTDDIGSLSYEANTTIRQLMHVNSRRWAAKAYSVGENLGIRIVYPFIWRDILIEQGKIPWKAKVNNGIVKWPLKRLLEEFMPNDFIYRKKSGFVPPFKQWLTAKKFNHMVRDVLLASDSSISRIVTEKIIDNLLSEALVGKNLRHAILNFLWGGLFT